MSYSVSLSENANFINCKLEDPITLEHAKEFALEVDRLSRATGVKRVFTDVRGAPNVLSVFQNYDFAYKTMEALQLQRDVRAATLTDRTDSTHNFAETVIRNAGYNMRLFKDEEAAIAWLCEEKSSK
jgi:hypothetical protein